MVKGGVHGEGAMHGEWEVYMAKGGHAWKEGRLLQQAVRILLACILVNCQLFEMHMELNEITSTGPIFIF